MKPKRNSKKTGVVLFLLICSIFLDVSLYQALKKAVPPPLPPLPENTAPYPTVGTGKEIYLTFDMDMNEFMYAKFEKKKTDWYDPALFGYLETQNVPATFFVSGLFIQAYPDLMKGLASDADFSFQNHSYDESSFVLGCYWLSTLTNTVEKVSQIERTEDLIRQTTGQTASYFRFPGICHDSGNDALVRSLNLQINDGTIISGDPFNENVPAIVHAVMSRAQNNAVVVMHVGGPNAPGSLAALEIIVPELRAEGYSFAKL